MAKENPKLNKNVLKRHLHKKRIQKQFKKQANTAKRGGATRLRVNLTRSYGFGAKPQQSFFKGVRTLELLAV